MQEQRRGLVAAIVTGLAGASLTTVAATKRRVVWTHGDDMEEGTKKRIVRWFTQEGWSDGPAFSLEFANVGASHMPASIEQAARAVVASRPDVIVGDGALFKPLTADIPVVFSNAWCDATLVRQGLVQSLRHPGGNFTGSAQPLLVAKSYAIAKQLKPRLKRVGTLALGTPEPPIVMDAIREAARNLDVEVVEILYPPGSPFSVVERAILAARVDAVDVGLDAGDVPWLAELARFLERQRIIGHWGEAIHIRNGGLFAVHHDGSVGLREAVRIVAKILAGEKPADIPVDVIRDVHVTVNQATARRMGIALPPDVLTEADIVYGK
jgi:putative ABC transport system substrate-binding protein